MAINRKGLTKRVHEIEALERTGCIALWREAFMIDPPKHLSPQFMRRVLIHEAQRRTEGGLPRTAEQRLGKQAQGRAARPMAKTGSRLVREWNGRTYHVEVVEGGYLMDGQRWRSLSAIARHITGARWSGPRFFGVA